jgi:hypothetical protein
VDIIGVANGLKRRKVAMKPLRKHVAIAVDGGGIKGVIGITEATEWTESTESTEGASVSSVSFSIFSDSNFGWLTGVEVVEGTP